MPRDCVVWLIVKIYRYAAYFQNIILQVKNTVDFWQSGTFKTLVAPDYQEVL